MCIILHSMDSSAFYPLTAANNSIVGEYTVWLNDSLYSFETLTLTKQFPVDRVLLLHSTETYV